MGSNPYCPYPIRKRTKTVKPLLITKFLFLLLLSAGMQVSANGFGQTVTLNEKNTSLQKIFKSINQQTGYKFFYEDELIKKAGKIDIAVKNVSVEDALKICFKNLPFGFAISKNTIVVTEIPSTEEKKNPGMVVNPIVIKGIVKDEDGKPLSGANIIVKGTHNGTTTNDNGEFSINADDGASVLVISYAGMATREVSVKGNPHIVITLKALFQDNKEVVVVAFGSKLKSTLIESVTKLDENIVKDKPVNNILSALQGQVAGVNITSSSGQPGVVGTINIRGVGSMLTPTSPLTIIDGVPGSLNLIDPNDVESISVLKDAAASSIYGARAANGVIIVTTKRGKLGKIAVSYSTYVGWQKPTELFKESDAYNYANAYNEATMYDLITPGNTTFDSSKIIFTTPQLNGWKSGAVASSDWRKALFTGNSGFTQSHYVNVTGGLNNGNVTFKTSFSFGYLQQTGNVANTDYKRYSIRSNNELKWDKFDANLSVGLVTDNRNEPSSKAVGNFGSIISAIDRQRPVDSIKLHDGSWNITSTNDTRNPVRQAAEGGYNNPQNYNILLNFNLAYSILKDLTVKYTTGLSYNFNSASIYQNSLAWYNGTTTGPNFSQMSNYLEAHNMQQVDLSYSKDIQQHHFSMIAGAQEELHNYNADTAARGNFINNSSNSLQLGDPTTQTNTSSKYNWALLGMFGRFNYDYDRKYLFEFNCREDGSSRLSPGKRWGFFPSVSAGWRASEEKFWAGLKNTLPEFKLRASYGTLGNANLPGSDNNLLYYSSQSIVGNIYASNLGLNYASVFDGTIYSALSLIQSPNNTITWEKTSIADIAIEGNLLSSRLSYSIDYFNKTTNGMLIPQQVSDVNGGAPYIANIGKMRNSGIEVTLGYSHRSGNGFSYSLNGNYTYLTNKILNLGGQIQSINPDGVTRNAAGLPLNAYSLYLNDGYLTESEFNSSKSKDPILTGQKWGDQRIKDVNGDNAINASDRVMIHKSGTPKHLFGLNFDFSYKGFGVAGILQGAADYYRYLGASTGYGFNSGYGITNWTIANSYNPVINPNNYNTRLPRVSTTNTINNTYPSDLFLFNSSYARLKNIQVYYDLQSRAINKLHIRNLRMYLSGQNLFTLSALPKALGIDPEISSATAGYPLVKIYTMGVNVSF
jgi:TonB-linked SusC/RagA family outer membrane protein